MNEEFDQYRVGILKKYCIYEMYISYLTIPTEDTDWIKLCIHSLKQPSFGWHWVGEPSMCNTYTKSEHWWAREKRILWCMIQEMSV